MPMPDNATHCFLGLGSNLDDPIKQLKTAIKHLGRLRHTCYIQSASWYQTKAWGVTAQNDFTNTVVEIRTGLTPMALLKAIKVIEYRLMNRQPNKKWHARKIDIDILIYGRHRVNRKQLIIPHPLISERLFVSKPLLQLRPDMPFALKQQLLNSQTSQNNEATIKLISKYQPIN